MRAERRQNIYKTCKSPIIQNVKFKRVKGMSDVTGAVYIGNKLTDKLALYIYSLLCNILKDVNDLILENVSCNYHEK